MTWDDVALWLRRHTCYDRQAGEACGHAACSKATVAIEHAERLAAGKSGDIDIIGDYIFRKLCRQNQNEACCHHTSCHRAVAVLEWVAKQVRNAA